MNSWWFINYSITEEISLITTKFHTFFLTEFSHSGSWNPDYNCNVDSSKIKLKIISEKLTKYIDARGATSNVQTCLKLRTVCILYGFLTCICTYLFTYINTKNIKLLDISIKILIFLIFIKCLLNHFYYKDSLSSHFKINQTLYWWSKM